MKTHIDSLDLFISSVKIDLKMHHVTGTELSVG